MSIDQSPTNYSFYSSAIYYNQANYEVMSSNKGFGSVKSPIIKISKGKFINNASDKRIVKLEKGQKVNLQQNNRISG